jgi:phosphoglycolate phosphatase
MIMEHILWDLDGTLTDPKFGIIQCIQYALEKFGIEPPPLEQLFWCIGPPLYESFPKLVPDASREEILTLVDLYRERFGDIGMYENEVYPGISDLLNELQLEQKHYVATSKPHVFAKKILSHFNLIQYFSVVHGSELSGVRSDKGELIKFILESESLDPNKTVMIGDRKHDIIGAKKVGMMSIGITWGYGSREEHQEAGADYIFSTPQELGKFLNPKN